MKKKLLNELQNIGLSETESLVYFVLHKGGNSSLSKLVKCTALSRSVLNTILKKLLTRDYIEIINKRPVQYASKSVYTLLSSIDEELAKLAIQKSKLLSFIPVLEMQFSSKNLTYACDPKSMQNCRTGEVGIKLLGNNQIITESNGQEISRITSSELYAVVSSLYNLEK